MVKNTKVGFWCSYVTYATGVVQTRRWTRRWSSFLYVCHILFSWQPLTAVVCPHVILVFYWLVIGQLHDSSCSSCKSPLQFQCLLVFTQKIMSQFLSFSSVHLLIGPSRAPSLQLLCRLAYYFPLLSCVNDFHSEVSPQGVKYNI